MSRIILVGGGSSSGKSYVTTNVIERIGEENITRINNYKNYEPVTHKQFDKVNRTTSVDDALKAAGISISMDNVKIEGGGDKDDFMKSLKEVSPYNPIEIAE